VETTVLFIDVVDSVALGKALGDAVTGPLFAECLAAISAEIVLRKGRVIKTMGDGLLAVLPHPDDAAEVTLWVNQTLRRTLEPSHDPLRFHAGFHFGPVVDRGSDIHGDTVNTAARLCGHAKADHILILEDTAAQLSDVHARKVRYCDRDKLKGFASEVTILDLSWNPVAETVAFGRTLPSPAPKESEGAEELHLEYWRSGQSQPFANEDLPITVGRDVDACKIALRSPGASRIHLKIERRRGKFVITDTSLTGTFVSCDDTPGELPAKVHRGEWVLQGSGRIAFEPPSSGGEAEVIRYRVVSGRLSGDGGKGA
jgi:class 3 adenylate cyclase